MYWSEISFNENPDWTEASEFAGFYATRAHSERYFQTDLKKNYLLMLLLLNSQSYKMSSWKIEIFSPILVLSLPVSIITYNKYWERNNLFKVT